MHLGAYKIFIIGLSLNILIGIRINYLYSSNFSSTPKDLRNVENLLAPAQRMIVKNVSLFSCQKVLN